MTLMMSLNRVERKRAKRLIKNVAVLEKKRVLFLSPATFKKVKSSQMWEEIAQRSESAVDKIAMSTEAIKIELRRGLPKSFIVSVRREFLSPRTMP